MSLENMKPRIVFLVMSAVNKVETVDQLAHALAPHTVLVHHDFTQTPDFPLTASNAIFVPNAKRTGWAFFGFVDGIFHSLQYALSHLEFDYLQLLSPTCLPIKPLREFEEMVAGGAEAHFDCIDLLADHEALMGVGYRAFTPDKSFRHRLARRASDVYFAHCTGRRDEAGIWLRSGGGKGFLSWPAALLVYALSRRSIGRHIFNNSFRPYYGTAWFGARQAVVAGMVEVFSRAGIRDYFSRLRIAEEFLIPSMLMQLATSKGPMNHLVQKFDGAHTGSFNEGDIERLRASSAFFARKFPDDPCAPIRLRVLDELVGVKPSLSDAQCVSARPHGSMQAPGPSAKPGANPPLPVFVRASHRNSSA